MTFEQAFIKIKAKFADCDLSKLLKDFAIQVNMTDEDAGGAFYIQSLDGKLFVEPYDYHDNTADVTLKRLDLIKILDGKLTVEKAIESGKLYVNGNADDLKVAASVIKAPEKKAAPKKAQVKKAEVKTEAKKEAPKKAEAKAEVKKTAKAPAKKTSK